MTTYRNENLTEGDTTRWLYDEPSGCMTNKVYADGKGPSYSYTPDGKLARRTWARGIVTEYTYDNAGNLTRTEYNDNGVTPTITMAYDRVGNLVNATTAGVVTNLCAYDIVGNCTNEWQNDFNLTRYYDTLGRSTGYAINGERQTVLRYDAATGRLITMQTRQGRSGLPTASNGGEFTWTYLPGSDLKASLQYPNGLTASWAYDANNQLLQVRNATPTNVISQFDYTYDAAGRRTAITKTGSAFGDLSGSVDAYAYNARSELTSARRTKNGQPIPGFSEDFDYDPIGNRRSSSTYNEKGEAQTSTYEANNLNQYTTRSTPGYAAVRGEADPNATVTVNENPTFRLGSYYFGSDLFDNSTAGGLANLETYATLGQFAANGDEAEDLVSATTNQVYLAQSPETFAYDDDGNQTLITTKTGLWRVTYNGENRPVRWVRDSDNTTLVMSYDHMGRRREKNGQTFFYNNYLLIRDNMGSGYIWDALESFTATPLLWRSLEYGVEMFYCYDANKNVVSVIDGHENIMCQYEYSPFGEGLSRRGYLVNNQPFGFSAEYKDEETGLICFNYRESLPHYGNWTTRDPIAERGGINLYLFSRNSPINYVDVNGQSVWAIPIAGFVGGAIVGVGCQLFRDAILGVPPIWEDYVGAALSGGMFGAVAMLSPGMAMWARAGMGAISAGLGNITSQELKIHVSETATEVDYVDFAVASSVGAVFTFVKADRVIGLNSGRNSSLALAKSISTKAKNGSISSVKSKTLIKAWDGVRQDFGFQDGWKQNIIKGVSNSVVSFIVLNVSGEDDCGNAVDILYKEERRYEK